MPVTSVVGKTEEAAKKELEAAKLKVEIVHEEDTTKTNGTVLKQSIAVGEVVDEGTKIVLTVNKLAEIKQGTVNVNLKSLLKYNPPTNTNEEIEVPKVQVKIKVGEDVVYSEKHLKDTTKITKQIEGIGTVTVRVYVDDVLQATKTLDLNSANPVLNFE